jgi:hypothetical protein
MKRFALSLSLPVLGALAFAMACSDATSPDPHAALRPGTPNPALQGNLPPPPTATAVEITISDGAVAAAQSLGADVATLPVTGFFTGVYFANPNSVEALTAASEVGDLTLLVAKTAWLRLDNDKAQSFGSTASANARFQIVDGASSGKGTLFISGLTIHIVDVTRFSANPDCLVLPVPCASIDFTATIDQIAGTHTGHAVAFSRDVCIFTVENETRFNCPPEFPDVIL